MLVEMVPLDHLLARLCRHERHLKNLGMAAHAEAVRGVIALIQRETQESKTMVDDGGGRSAIVAMVASLTERSALPH